MMRRIAVVFACLAGCTSDDPTRIAVVVHSDPAWGLDHYELRIGQLHAIAEPLTELEIEVPDHAAAQETTVELWGLVDGQQIAYGSTMVTPVLHGRVDAVLTPHPVSCGMFCVEGTVACSDNGVTACEAQGDGCLAWSEAVLCSPDLPFCSNGKCANFCSDECTAGQTECDSADGIRICGQFDDDPCLDWSGAFACGDGETCQNGGCGGVEACSPDGGNCDDGNACTKDTCAQGVCMGTPKCTTAPVNADATCDAGNCGFKCRPFYSTSGGSCVPAPVGAMSTIRSAHAAVAVDGKIYAIGGFTVDPNQAVATVEAYDRATNKWSMRVAMDHPRAFPAAVAGPDGRIYVMGGNDTTNLVTMEAYDPGTGRWSARRNMRAPRSKLGAAVGADGRIYAFGGLAAAGFQRTVDVYDPATDTWAPRAQMPIPLMGMGVVAARDGKIYVIGGITTNYIQVADVNAYDPATNTWQARNPLPYPVSEMGVAVGPDGNIYVMGGNVATGGTAAVEAYDLLLHTWSARASMPVSRHNYAAVRLGPLIYAIGGREEALVRAYSSTGDVW